MNITVVRKYKTLSYSIGRLFVDDVEFCHTLEPSEHPESNAIEANAVPKITFFIILQFFFFIFYCC